MSKISLIIPAYNEEKNIANCLNSIQEEITRNQIKEIEIIVVNNASTDNTQSITLSFPMVSVVEEKRKGLVWARQAGFLASSGDLIANIDADTLLPKGWIATLLREFENDPKLLALSGPQIYFDAPMRIRVLVKIWYALGFSLDSFFSLFTKKRVMLQGGNFVIHRDALEKIGGYNTEIAFYGEDTDVGKRLGKIGKIKWTFRFPILASGRRIMEKGLLKAMFLYLTNFLSIVFRGKPFTQKYDDIR